MTSVRIGQRIDRTFARAFPTLSGKRRFVLEIAAGGAGIDVVLNPTPVVVGAVVATFLALISPKSVFPDEPEGQPKTAIKSEAAHDKTEAEVVKWP